MIYYRYNNNSLCVEVTGLNLQYVSTSWYIKCTEYCTFNRYVQRFTAKQNSAEKDSLLVLIP